MGHVWIEIELNKIETFCRKWRVREFSLFGYVISEDFRSDSDVDVLVSFEEEAKWSMFDLVDMVEELKVMFGRDVDLLEKEALRNPYRRRAILSHRDVLYAA